MPSANPAAIRLVGSPRVQGDSASVDVRAFGGPRCATVFAYLSLNHGRAVRYEDVAAVVWSDERPHTWASALRSVISKIRELLTTTDVLARCTLVGRSGALRLTLAPSVAVDLDIARRHLDVSEDSPAIERTERASRVLELLDAPVLDGLHGPWADEVREIFDRIRLRALEIGAVASAELGRHDQALRRSTELLEADRLCESAYRVAMRAHAALGNRARALSVAQQCRTVLAAELGVEMSADTQAVFAELLVDPPSARNADYVGETYIADEPASAISDHGGDRSDNDIVVGFTVELRSIASAIDSASRGRAHLVVVTGEAGAGKTTLVTHAVRQAENAGADVLFGRCSMDALIPFEPFIDALVGEWDVHSVDRALPTFPPPRGDTIGGPELWAMLTTGWGEPSRWSAEGLGAEHRSILVSAVEQWLTGPTRDSVTVLVIDDVHWSSPATMSVLHHLLHSAARRRLCVVVTVRASGRGRNHADGLRPALSPSAVTTVAVQALGVAEISDWVQQIGSELDPTWLHEWTSGSPILVAAVLDAARRDPLRPSPSSLDDAVHRVLHRLSATARDVVVMCAAAGPSTTRDVVRAALDYADLQFAAALDELCSAGLVDPSHDKLTVRHALIADVINATVSDSRRATTHSAIAAALIKVGATQTVDELARVAEHLARGLDADRTASADFLRKAGDRSYAVAAFEDAAEFYARALESTIPRGPTRERCELLIRQGRAQRRALDRDYRAALFDAVEIALLIDDVDLLVKAITSDVIDGIALMQLYEPNPVRMRHLRAGLDALDRAGRSTTASAAELLTQAAEEMAWTSSGWSHRADQLARAVDIARATD